MDPRTLLEILHTAERLKDATRHSWTSQGRHESVAEHSWRLALMVILATDWFPEADIGRAMKMAILHDMGEAFTGDIPAFYKTDADREVENRCVADWCAGLPEPLAEEFGELFDEMEALKTIESRIVKAMDKLEVLVQHNEADLSTWIPLEYEKNLVHGEKYTAFSDEIEALRQEIVSDSRKKIAGKVPQKETE